MQTIYFGLQCDQTYFDGFDSIHIGNSVVGPIGLLRLLENFTGNSGYTDDVEFLRIEAYRKALRATVNVNSDTFYAASFQVNEFATAKTLLSYRDELLLAGFDFKDKATMPVRLQQFCAIEAALATNMAFGYTERYVALLGELRQFILPICKVFLIEPLTLLPTYFQRLFEHLAELGITIQQHQVPKSSKKDLIALQNNLLGKQLVRCKLEDSMSILTADSESIAAQWLAKWLQQAETTEALLLLPDHKRLLDVAFQNEGLPMMGIHTASVARPSLQLLKLVSVFFWKPLDCEQLISFLLLPLKPLDDEVAFRLAADIAQRPGNNLEDWQKIILQHAKKERWSYNQEVFEQLFLQRKYDRSAAVPKSDVLKLYNYLSRWILTSQQSQFDSSIAMLRETVKRLIVLLESMDDEEFTFASLHHIINVIVDPVSVVVDARELGSLPLVFRPAQIIQPTELLIWWNFVEETLHDDFDFWRAEERNFLQCLKIQLNTVSNVLRLKFWQSIQPFFYVKNRVLLFIPASIDGKSSNEHPLWSYLQATFSNLEEHIFDLGDLARSIDFGKKIGTVPIQQQQFGPLRTMLQLPVSGRNFSRELESPSSLEKYIYYPHQWFFEYQLQLQKTTMVAMNDLFTIKGNTAHRLIELFYKENVDAVIFDSWFTAKFQSVLEVEGALLLTYGYEPERRSFENALRAAIPILANTLKANDWEVVQSEMSILGAFNGVAMQGIMDLVAWRGEELLVIDIKYSGLNKRSNLVKNNEDLQLFFYQQLLQQSQKKSVKTAYFIVDQAKFITKFPAILEEAILVTYKKDLHEVLDLQGNQIVHTLEWRSRQLHEKQLELRFEGAVKQLEHAYEAEAMLDYLEMKSTSDPYDKYLTLLSNNYEKVSS